MQISLRLNVIICVFLLNLSDFWAASGKVAKFQEDVLEVFFGPYYAVASTSKPRTVKSRAMPSFAVARLLCRARASRCDPTPQ